MRNNPMTRSWVSLEVIAPLFSSTAAGARNIASSRPKRRSNCASTAFDNQKANSLRCLSSAFAPYSVGFNSSNSARRSACRGVPAGSPKRWCINALKRLHCCSRCSLAKDGGVNNTLANDSRPIDVSAAQSVAALSTVHQPRLRCPFSSRILGDQRFRPA